MEAQMPWRVSGVMSERLRLVVRFNAGESNERAVS
jgi:hypothetical protein